MHNVHHNTLINPSIILYTFSAFMIFLKLERLNFCVSGKLHIAYCLAHRHFMISFCATWLTQYCLRSCLSMQKQSATVTENRKISFMESQIFQNGQNTIWKCSLCAAFVAITLRVLMNHYYTARLQSLLCAEKIFSAHFWMCPRKIYRIHTVRAIFCKKTLFVESKNIQNAKYWKQYVTETPVRHVVTFFGYCLTVFIRALMVIWIVFPAQLANSATWLYGSQQRSKFLSSMRYQRMPCDV